MMPGWRRVRSLRMAFLARGRRDLLVLLVVVERSNWKMQTGEESSYEKHLIS